jgi:hypothetical protein
MASMIPLFRAEVDADAVLYRCRGKCRYLLAGKHECGSGTKENSSGDMGKRFVAIRLTADNVL